MEGGGAGDGDSRFGMNILNHPILSSRAVVYGIKLSEMKNVLFVCEYPVFAGVGIGVVDVGYERRLANHLGAHRTPSILGVINGKVTFFHYAVAKEHLRQFVEDLLPQRLVERVNVCLSCDRKDD